MLFKKRQTVIIIVVLVAVLAVSLVIFKVSRTSDACTPKDRQQNNCVPAGRCTPPGDSRESMIDCELKNYDHKFDLGK